MVKTSLGLEENLVGTLCYLLGWLTGIFILVLERYNGFVQFHAMQSIVTFLSLTVIGLLVGWIPIIGWVARSLIGLLSLILWLLLMFRAYQGEMYKLPIVGDFVEGFQGDAGLLFLSHNNNEGPLLQHVRGHPGKLLAAKPLRRA